MSWKSIAMGLAITTAAAVPTAFPASAQSGDKIRIGMSVSSTGDFALQSQAGERGISIWVDDVNSRGGIQLGGKKYRIELVKLDDRSDKQMTPRVYETLIQDEKVDLLIAPFGSTLTGSAVTISEKYGKFMISWSASSDALYKQGYKNLVSAIVQASDVPGAAITLAKTLGAKKVAVVYADEPFPAALAAAAATAAQANGLQVVMNEKYAKGTRDFSVIIGKAQAAGADVFFPTSYEGDTISIVRQMKEMNVTFPFTYTAYANTPQFLEIGKDSLYIFSHTPWMPGADFKVTDGLANPAFLAAYKRLFPNANYGADFQTALGYGAGAVLERIIISAGSLDAAKLKQAALAISGKVTVLTGEFAVDETGYQTGMKTIVLQNLAGGVKPVYPLGVRAADPVYPMPAWDKR